MDITNIKTFLRIPLYSFLCQLYSFICRVIQDLDFELLARIIDLRNSPNQTFYDIHLVEEWQLNGDLRQLFFFEMSKWFGNKLTVPPEIDHLLNPVAAINCEGRQDGEI